MNARPGSTDLERARLPLTEKQARAAEMYVAGPPSVLGSKVEAYVSAYDWNGGRAGARSKASGLFARVEVREYVRALRAAGTAASVGKLRDWAELAADAQETLHAAATGKLPKGLSDEAVRSAVRAASYIVDRAFGTPSQQIELRQTGGIVVHVAGPATLGRMIESNALEADQVRPPAAIGPGLAELDSGQHEELTAPGAGGADGGAARAGASEYGASPDSEGPHIHIQPTPE